VALIAVTNKKRNNMHRLAQFSVNWMRTECPRESSINELKFMQGNCSKL